jgi:isopenicillin-N epimerase
MLNNEIKDLFMLNEEVTFLNFGSFGACPTPIFDRYVAFQREMECDPVQFITNWGIKYLKDSRESLAQFIHCDPDDVVMVTNPSYAVNTIAKSMHLQAGDEILTTDLEYGACDRTWNFVCGQVGAKYVRQPIALPLTSKEQFVEDLFKGVSNKTKLIFISEITSTTALIFPVKEVIIKAKEMGIPVFVDGAHVPGHIPLNISEMDPDYYTGACHKWMMTPKGSSFMYIKRVIQETVKPLVVSWGYEALFPSHSQFLDWHQVNGTRDFTAMLCIPEAIKFRKENNWEDVSSNSKGLVKDNALDYIEVLDSYLLAPLKDDFIGQMLAAPIKTPNPEKLYRTFVDDYRVEVPVMRHDDKVYLRFSINGFNSQRDIDTLIAAISDIKERGELLL